MKAIPTDRQFAIALPDADPRYAMRRGDFSASTKPHLHPSNRNLTTVPEGSALRGTSLPQEPRIDPIVQKDLPSHPALTFPNN
jgi:hypothetical protein